MSALEMFVKKQVLWLLFWLKSPVSSTILCRTHFLIPLHLGLQMCSDQGGTWRNDYLPCSGHRVCVKLARSCARCFGICVVLWNHTELAASKKFLWFGGKACRPPFPVLVKLVLGHKLWHDSPLDLIQHVWVHHGSCQPFMNLDSVTEWPIHII